MPRVAISLGSNLGDRLSNLRFGVKRLSRSFSLTAVSSLYLTAPVGGPSQHEYLNAVVLIDSDQPPLEILSQLQGIEAAAGRVRQERFGPRTLDLDLVAMEGVTRAGADLELPHPRAHQRRFVVEPLTEVWPEAPLSGGPAFNLVRTVRGQQAIRVAEEWRADPIRFSSRGIGWIVAQLGLLAVGGILILAQGTWPPRGWSWLGLALIVFGFYLMVSAAFELGPALTPNPTPRPTSLAEAGVYRWVRHPIYMGVLVGALGAVVLWQAWLALGWLGILAAFFALKAQFEERRLRIVYPQYEEYAKRVRSSIFPGAR